MLDKVTDLLYKYYLKYSIVGARIVTLFVK